jgi:hypothetical protein
VKNFNYWLTGDFDTLVLLNKAEIMSPDSSTLHFVKEAEKYFSQKQLERIASLANPSLSSPQLQPDPQQQRGLSITMRLDKDDLTSRNS